MKKSVKRKILKTYKKKLQTLTRNISFLGILVFLFFLLFLLDHASTLIKPVEPKKVFATEATKKVSLLLTEAQVLSISEDNKGEDAAQEFSSLFTISSLITATPTPPVETKKMLQQEPVQNGYCLTVPMLMYHHVQPLAEAQSLGHAQLTVDSQIFDEQMSYLVAQGYHFISSSDVAAALISHQQLTPKSIVITLDDGYDDAYNYAYPIAKKYNITIDLMIPSGLINNSGYLTWAQLKEMSENSLVHVYNHTWSHAALANADEAKIQQEVMTANNQLEATLGKKINIFTYPYGSFGPAVIAFLQQHGFIAGISTLDGKVQCDSYIMTLHRTRVGNTTLSYYGL